MSIKIDVREIDPFSLPALPLEDRLNLPDVCAIYFTRSYFSSTEGLVSQETIQRYLDAQQGV